MTDYSKRRSNISPAERAAINTSPKKLREFALKGYFSKNPPIAMLGDAYARQYFDVESLIDLDRPFGSAYLKFYGKNFKITRKRKMVLETNHADWLTGLKAINLIPRQDSEGNVSCIIVRGYEDDKFLPIYGKIEPSKDGEGLIAYKTS